MVFKAIPILWMLFYCKSMMLTAFGMRMRVVLKHGRMEELGCWHQKEHVKYINKCHMKEHLFVLSCINANGRCNPNFYIFKGKQFWRNYTKGCETRLSKRMQPSAWVMAFLCDKWLEHFIACVKKNMETCLLRTNTFDYEWSCKSYHCGCSEQGKKNWLWYHYIAFSHTTCFTTS